VALHFGKAEQPQNFSPALVPFFAVLNTIFEPQIGQTLSSVFLIWIADDF
jgi:hypothetical protein